MSVQGWFYWQWNNMQWYVHAYTVTKGLTCIYYSA